MQPDSLITLNHTRYSLAELQQLCHKKLNENAPQWEKDIYAFIRQWLEERDSIEVQTSGSTGIPKRILLKKAWMDYSARQTCNFFGLNADNTALLCLPAAYIAGKMMIVRAFVSGFNLITQAPEGNPFLNLEEKTDFAAITPFQLHQSLPMLVSNPMVKTIIVGGGEINPALESEIRDLTTEIFATYGMTETSSHIALKKVNGLNKDNYFRVMGDTQIKTDERGCLTIYNPNLFDGWLITNDMVQIKDDKQFRWLGRYDNIINSGGIKISPEEIEQAVSQLREEKMMVTSIPDAKLGEAVVLVIERKKLADSEKENLFRKMEEILPPYHQPKKIVCLEKIPLTETGKPDRLKISQRVATTLAKD